MGKKSNNSTGAPDQEKTQSDEVSAAPAPAEQVAENEDERFADPTRCNPLRQYRRRGKPGEWIPREETQRAANSTGVSRFLIGDFAYTPDPQREVQLTTWDEDERNPRSYDFYTSMLSRGWQLANPEEWWVKPELRVAWKASADGKIVFGSPASPHRRVLMWRDAEHADREQAYHTRVSDHVERHMKEGAEEALADSVGELGGTMNVDTHTNRGGQRG